MADFRENGIYRVSGRKCRDWILFFQFATSDVDSRAFALARQNVRGRIPWSIIALRQECPRATMPGHSRPDPGENCPKDLQQCPHSPCGCCSEAIFTVVVIFFFAGIFTLIWDIFCLISGNSPSPIAANIRDFLKFRFGLKCGVFPYISRNVKIIKSS